MSVLALASFTLLPSRADAGCSLLIVAGSYSQSVPADFGAHEISVNTGGQSNKSVVAIHGCVAVPASIPKHPDPLHPVLS